MESGQTERKSIWARGILPAMKQDELREWRRQRLELLVQEYGSATNLGLAIGHTSGAQISGMIAKHRLISEKTIFAIEALPGLKGYFTGFVEDEPTDVGEALSAVLKVLAGIPEPKRSSARYAVHYLLDNPQKLGEIIQQVVELRGSGRRGRSL